MKTRILLLLLVCASSMAMAQDKLPPERKAKVDSLALEKVRDLSKYISIIGDKKTSHSEGARVIARACELFMTGSQMGVSSLGKKDVTYLPVKKYLERLQMLNYQTVTIEWFNIDYISDLEKQPDGRYVGVITIYQKFEGVTKEGLKYKDVTKKDITIYVERKQTQINGRLIGFWDVMLGDIKVSETKPGPSPDKSKKK